METSTLKGDLRIDAGGGGVRFTPNNTGNSDPNCLDDYEEGSWTVKLDRTTTSPTVSMNSIQGTYVKIGPQVTIWGFFNINSISGGSGNYIISGLPFTARNDASSGRGSVNVGEATEWTGSNDSVGVTGIINNNTKNIVLKFVDKDGANGFSISNVNAIGNGSFCKFNATYCTDE